jgi:hypothetical protein
MRRTIAALALAAMAGCARAKEPPAAARTEPPAAETTTAPRSCFRLDLAPLRLVRVDEPQRRLFVVASDAAAAPIAARIRDLDACFDLTDWGGRWSLSVFTDATLARYKDDPQVEGAVKDGRWAKAYLAEYDAATKTTTRNPASPK